MFGSPPQTRWFPPFVQSVLIFGLRGPVNSQIRHEHRKTGRQKDRRIGGQEGRRTGGQKDKRTGGHEDKRTGEQNGSRTGGQEDRRTGETPDPLRATVYNLCELTRRSAATGDWLVIPPSDQRVVSPRARVYARARMQMRTSFATHNESTMSNK